MKCNCTTVAKYLYAITFAYVVIRITTFLMTYYGHGAVHSIAWDANRNILNNLGFIVVILFGAANGLVLYEKSFKTKTRWLLIASIISGIFATLFIIALIWIFLFMVCDPYSEWIC